MDLQKSAVPTEGRDPEEAELLRRLRDGDVTAPADLAVKYLEPLAQAVSRAFPKADEHALISAAIDAILGVAEHPDRVDLSKGSLARYLRMSARGDFLNALETKRARERRERSLEAVEVVALERNMYRNDPNADPTAEDAVRKTSQIAPSIQLRDVATGAELAVLQAMLEGERRTRVFADILGIGGLEPAAQRAEVKKVKDRLNQRLRRTRGNQRE